jgi:dienelactone hydrolase
MRAALRLLPAVLFSVLVACAQPTADPGTPEAVLSRTWMLGALGLPYSVLENADRPNRWPARMFMLDLENEELRPGAKAPAVVLMHGCQGIGPTERIALKLMREAGYAVFSPDHFGRPEVRQVCAGGSGKSRFDWVDFYPAYVPYRVEEMRYAVAKVRAMPFIDQSRVFIMGHSAGGATGSRWSTPDVAGVILTGWDCAVAWAPGLFVPATVPTLFITDANDPWLPRSTAHRCSDFTRTRGNSTDLVMRNDDHMVISYPEAQKALLHFLATAGR